RAKLKAALEVVSAPGSISVEEAVTAAEMVLKPAIQGVADMIMKEEEILLPMCLDKLTEGDWHAIYQQTMEFGYCLYDPEEEWSPEGIAVSEVEYQVKDSIQLTTGNFRVDELEALFKVLPVDLTFVDKADKVRFFSLGPDRIFTRNRAILGRDVRMCHPPSSVHVVDQILDDFRSGKENSAAFWINMQGKFIYIEYFAMRGKNGEYLGTVEYTQDLTHLRKLEGEQRLLSYTKK
ncbi:MAG TPA: PAS domain-containing protein, partial [Bacteroidales bacterium]|nr:PAS domain-containing protein [Bacteroidales bacterium]